MTITILVGQTIVFRRLSILVVCGRQNNKYALDRGAGNLACSRLSRLLLRPSASHRSPPEPAESRLQPGLAVPQNGQDFGRTTLGFATDRPYVYVPRRAGATAKLTTLEVNWRH